MEGHGHRGLAIAAHQVMEDTNPELVAEEAQKLPTTVGQRLASRMGKPWADVDIDGIERQRAGIYDELRLRPCGPLLDDDEGSSINYVANADGTREQHWVSKISEFRVSRVVFICGLLHLAPLASKFRSAGWTVDEISVCDLEWYKKRFGRLEVFEEDGRRWCEIRPNSKN